MIYEPDPLFDAPQDPPATPEVQGPPPPEQQGPMPWSIADASPSFDPSVAEWLKTPVTLPPSYSYVALDQLARSLALPSSAELMAGADYPGLARYLNKAPEDASLWTDEAGTLRRTEDTWGNIGRAFVDGLYTDNALGMIYAKERHGIADEAELEYARRTESRRPIPEHWYNNVARVAGNVMFYGSAALTGAFTGAAASPAGSAFGAVAAPLLATNLISGGHLYHRMRNAGVPHDTAYAMSMIGGAGTAALEYIGGRWLTQAATRAVLRDVAKDAAEQLVGAPRLFHSGPISQRLMTGLAVSAQEAVTEGAQNLWEDAVNAASIVGTRPKNWFELEPEDKAKYVTLFDSMEKLRESLSEAADVAWMTLYSMGLGTSVTTTGYTATMMLSNEERIRRGKQNKDLLEQVASIKKGSKVAQQGGEFEQALRAQAEEYGGETAYMDRLRAKKVLAEADKAAVEAAKAAGQTPASQTPATDLVAAQMPELVQQLNDESVTTVAVPTAALADKLGASEVGIALTQEVTLDPDDMPVAFEEALKELQKLQTRKIEERAEAEDAWGTSFEEAMAKFEETNAEALAKLPRATRYALTYSVRGWLVASATEGVMPLDVYNHLPVDVNVMARAQPAIAPVPSLTGFTHPLWRTLDDAQRTKLMGTKILTGGVLESAGDNLGPAVVYRLLGNHTMGENTFIVGEPQLEAGGGVSAAFVDVRNPFVEGQTVFAPDVLDDLVATVRANEAKAASDIESQAAVQLRAQQRKQGKRPKKRKIEPVQLSESLLTNAVDTFDGLVRAFGGGLDLNTEEGRVLAEQRAIDFLAKHKFDAVLDADIGTVRVVKKSQIVGEQVFTEQKHFDQYFPKSEGARVTSTAATYDWDNAQVTVHHLNNPIATMHEMMHHITSYLEQVTKVPNKLGTTQAHQMWQSLLKSWKTTQAKYDAADGDKKAKWVEQTAYQFEVYLTTGKPPAPQFKSLFRFLKRWATALMWGAQNDYADSRRAIYEKVYGRKLPVVSKELAQVFDTLMGAETGVQQMEASRNIEQIAESAEELAEIVGENPNLPSVKVPPIKEDTYQAALDLLPGVTELTPSSLQRMLGIGSVTARRIWNRLAKEGYLTETVQGTRTVVRPLLRSDVEVSPEERDANFLRSDVAPAVDAAFDEYQTLSEEVREELKEEATADGMKAMAWYRNARERLTREVLRKPAQAKLEKLQLEEWMRRRLRPVHRARHFFRTKEFLNEQGEAVPVQFGRMNTESVRKLTDPRTFKLLTNTAVSARGADPVLVAKMFGYDNVAEFLHDLAHAPTAKEEVLQAAGDRLKAENPELVEGTKEADIRLDELMHSELRGRKYALELKLLGKLKVEHADLHAAAKHQATGIVRGRLVGDIDAKRGTAPLHKVFQAEENKAALEVNNALAGKPNPQPGQGPQRGKRPPRDLNRAIDAKSRQLAAHERARAALAARTDIRTRMARMQKLLGRPSDSLASGHSMHLITFARDLAARVGLNIGKREGNGHRITAARLYAEQHFSELAFVSDEIVRLITNAGMLRDSLDGRLVRDLTYAEFDEVMTVLEGLTELARAERKEGRADRKEILDQQAAEFVDHYETWAEKHGANVAPGSEGTITFAQTVLNKLAEFRTSLTKMLAWCVRMDGDLKDGPFTRYIWDPISKADQAARHRNHVIQERLRDIVEPLRSKLTGDPIVAHELNGYVFRGRFEIFGLLQHMGNDSNKFKVVRGGRGTDVPPWFDSITAGVPDTGRVDKFMQRMIYEGVIDEQMLDAAQAIGDLYAELLPETQAAHYAVHGTTFPIVELRPFTITFRDGTQKEYRGWYTPARTDTNLHTHLTGTPSTRMDEEFLNSLPSVNSTWAIERSPTAKQPLTLDPDLLFTHMAEMVNYIHLQPALKGVNSLLLRDDVQRVIRRRDRQALDKLIWPWLDRVAKQQVFTPKDNALDQSVDWLRRRASMMLMSVNFVNALQNAVNPSPLLGVGVKPGTLANTFLRMVRQPRAMEQFAIQSSAFVNQRLESYSHLLHEQIKGSMKPGFWSQLSNARRWFQEKVAYRAQIWTQRWTDLIGWHAVYNQQLTDGASHEEAVAQADKMLQMVVGSFNPIDSTAFNSKSAVHHASAQFGDYFVTLANATATALNVKAHRGAGFAELAQTGAWMWIAPMVVGEMISKGFRGLDDEEYDYDSALANYSMALARETLLAPLRGAMQAVPLFGPMSQAALNHLVTEDAYDDRMRLPPAASLAVDLADMAGKLLTLEVDSHYFDNLLQLSSAAAGFAVPRQLPYLIKLGTGEKPMPDTIMETAAGIVAGGRRASF